MARSRSRPPNPSVSTTARRAPSPTTPSNILSNPSFRPDRSNQGRIPLQNRSSTIRTTLTPASYPTRYVAPQLPAGPPPPPSAPLRPAPPPPPLAPPLTTLPPPPATSRQPLLPCPSHPPTGPATPLAPRSQRLTQARI